MWTLHSVIEQVKKAAKWIVMGIVGIIILVLIIRLIGAIKRAITPPPAPSVEYGKIPGIVFPQYTHQDGTTYTIDTLDANLPTFPDRLPVHKIIHPTPTLQNLAMARGKIAAIGFRPTYATQLIETPLSELRYQWTDANTPPRVLTMDIDSFNFVLSTSYLSSLSPTSPTFISQSVDPQKTPDAVGKFLDKMSLLTTDIQTDINASESAPRIQYLKVADSLVQGDKSNAQAVRIDLFQNNVDIHDGVVNKFKISSLPIYYPNPNYSLINGILVPDSGIDPTIASFSYHHQVISDESSTYPIISATQAFEQLKTGNAYIAQHDNATAIAIKSISLGYYMSEDVVDYMLPIVIFKGDVTPEGVYQFYAYVPAVSGAYIK